MQTAAPLHIRAVGCKAARRVADGKRAGRLDGLGDRRRDGRRRRVDQCRPVRLIGRDGETDLHSRSVGRLRGQLHRRGKFERRLLRQRCDRPRRRAAGPCDRICECRRVARQVKRLRLPERAGGSGQRRRGRVDRHGVGVSPIAPRAARGIDVERDRRRAGGLVRDREPVGNPRLRRPLFFSHTDKLRPRFPRAVHIHAEIDVIAEARRARDGGQIDLHAIAHCRADTFFFVVKRQIDCRIFIRPADAAKIDHCLTSLFGSSKSRSARAEMRSCQRSRC